MKKRYKAYIAANRDSEAFDSCMGVTPESATRSIKRKNSPGFKDCFIWVVYIHLSGEEEKI